MVMNKGRGNSRFSIVLNGSTCRIAALSGKNATCELRNFGRFEGSADDSPQREKSRYRSIISRIPSLSPLLPPHLLLIGSLLPLLGIYLWLGTLWLLRLILFAASAHHHGGAYRQDQCTPGEPEQSNPA